MSDPTPTSDREQTREQTDPAGRPWCGVCTFCSKTFTEVEYIVSKWPFAICCECIVNAQEVVDEARAEKAAVGETKPPADADVRDETETETTR